MSASATELRAAVISRLQGNAGVQATAMGPQPRIVNRKPDQGGEAPGFPYAVVRVETRAWDTTSDRGKEHELLIHIAGEYEGDAEGEAIFFAMEAALRDWAPQTFSAHRLVNLVLRFEDVRSEPDGKRYFGMQRWRAVTEEL